MINVGPSPTVLAPSHGYRHARPLGWVLPTRQGGLRGVCPSVSGPRAAASVTVRINKVRVTAFPGFSPTLLYKCPHPFHTELSKSLSIDPRSDGRIVHPTVRAAACAGGDGLDLGLEATLPTSRGGSAAPWLRPLHCSVPW